MIACLSVLQAASAGAGAGGAAGARRPRFSYAGAAAGGQALGGVDSQSGLDRWRLVKPEEEVGVCLFSQHSTAQHNTKQHRA